MNFNLNAKKQKVFVTKILAHQHNKISLCPKASARVKVLLENIFECKSKHITQKRLIQCTKLKSKDLRNMNYFLKSINSMRTKPKNYNIKKMLK